MRIKVIIPVSTDKWDQGVASEYARIKQADTFIEVLHLDHGPEAIQSEYDEAKAAPYVLERVREASHEGWDAAIIYCFSDPALYGAREISVIPVLGIGESSQVLALSLADRIGIVTTLEQSAARVRRKVAARGLSMRFPAVRALNLPVLEYDNTEKVLEKALRVTRLMVDQDGVESVILGCGAIMGLREKIERTFGIPVIEPGQAALKHAEMICSLGLSHSKRSYMTPLQVKLKGEI